MLPESVAFSGSFKSVAHALFWSRGQSLTEALPLSSLPASRTTFKARLGYVVSSKPTKDTQRPCLKRKKWGRGGERKEGKERHHYLELLFMRFPCSVSPCIWGAGYLVLAPPLTVHKIIANPNESGGYDSVCRDTGDSQRNLLSYQCRGGKPSHGDAPSVEGAADPMLRAEPGYPGNTSQGALGLVSRLCIPCQAVY